MLALQEKGSVVSGELFWKVPTAEDSSNSLYHTFSAGMRFFIMQREGIWSNHSTRFDSLKERALEYILLEQDSPKVTELLQQDQLFPLKKRADRLRLEQSGSRVHLYALSKLYPEITIVCYEQDESQQMKLGDSYNTAHNYGQEIYLLYSLGQRTFTLLLQAPSTVQSTALVELREKVERVSQGRVELLESLTKYCESRKTELEMQLLDLQEGEKKQIEEEYKEVKILLEVRKRLLAQAHRSRQISEDLLTEYKIQEVRFQCVRLEHTYCLLLYSMVLDQNAQLNEQIEILSKKKHTCQIL